MCACAAESIFRPVSRTLKSDIQFGNGARGSDTWSRGPFVSGSQRPSPVLREGHINSRGIQLNGSKVLSKYDTAPKTSVDRCETPKPGGIRYGWFRE